MRALAREVAFKIVFENLFSDGEVDYDSYFEIDNISLEEDKSFVVDLVSLYQDNKQAVGEIINKNLVNYDPSRIYKIDRAIITVAVVEMKFYKQTPLAIVINEAVEMAKKYGTEKSYSFVNGILKTISKDI